VPAKERMTDAEFADRVERAARLAKADLTTGTVGEFPELQGIIGGYLAEAQGEKPGVVSALKQHYAPVPEGCIPVAVALADRLDTLVSFFAVKERPTGSRDPFALRRAAISIVEMIVRNHFRLSVRTASMKVFSKLIDEHFIFGMSDAAQEEAQAWLKHMDVGEVVEDAIPAFIADRLKVQQREAGVRHDFIDAVFALGGEDDLVRLLARVKALQAFVETDDGANLLAGYKRAANILRIEEKKDGVAYALDLSVPLSKYTDETEKNLARLFVPAEGSDATLLFDEADALFGREDFEGAMKLLATLRRPVDAFFEKVTVNDADPEVRARRLGLLAGIRDAMHKVADFSKIEG
jgi:glycyl-tRNA synthetase beta chain